MSKLKDIIYNATATSFCAGQDYAPGNGMTEKVDQAADTALKEIVSYMTTVLNNKREEYKGNPDVSSIYLIADIEEELGLN